MAKSFRVTKEDVFKFEKTKPEEKKQKKVAELPKIKTVETTKEPKTFEEMGLKTFSTGV